MRDHGGWRKAMATCPVDTPTETAISLRKGLSHLHVHCPRHGNDWLLGAGSRCTTSTECILLYSTPQALQAAHAFDCEDRVQGIVMDLRSPEQDIRDTFLYARTTSRDSLCPGG